MITGGTGCSCNVVLHIVERRARLRNNLLDADTQTVQRSEPELTGAAVAVAAAAHAAVTEAIAVPTAVALSSSLQQLPPLPLKRK